MANNNREKNKRTHSDLNSGTATDYLLELRDCSISFEGKKIVDSLSFEIKSAEVLSIMGPSGSGKSSLLNFICGNLNNDFVYEGQVILNGNDISSLKPEKRKIGILFQDDLLFPNLSVQDNLAFGVPQEIKGQKRKDIVAQALDDAGLAEYGRKDPATLSGGQRSRVALMRAFLARPEAILLDEPFNKLDASLRSRFRSFVFDEMRKYKLPCVQVTHDKEDAAAAGGRIIELSI